MDLSNYKEISIKEMQELELKVLLDVDKIARKNGIKYNLMFGTLLGAIRHHGFIPWDYDIDICLLRKEYDKLVDLLVKDEEFNKKYFVLNSKTDDKYYLPMTKIVINDTAFVSTHNFCPKYKYGIHIDLFPFEVQKLSEKQIQKAYKKKIKTLIHTNLKYGNPDSSSKVKRFLKSIVRLVTFWWTPRSFAKKLESYCVNSEAPLDECVLGDYSDAAKFIPAKWFKESIEVPFEGYMFPVPKDYDDILKFIYNDYMQLPPESERKGYFRGYIKVGK